MVFVDLSPRWLHVALLSIRNITLPKLLARIIKLRAHHLDYLTKSVRLYNDVEFTSKKFITILMTLGIDLEDHVVYVHSQNGLEEAFIKQI